MSNSIAGQREELLEAINVMDEMTVSLFAEAAERQGSCLSGFLIALMRYEAGKEFAKQQEDNARTSL